MAGRVTGATLLTLALLMFAAPQASALIRPVGSAADQVVGIAVSTVGTTSYEVTNLVAPEVADDLDCVNQAMPWELRIVQGLDEYGTCSAPGATCEGSSTTTDLQQTCTATYGPVRLRCDDSELVAFPDRTWTCSQEVRHGDLAIRRVCNDSMTSSWRGDSSDSWDCTVTATAGSASVELACHDDVQKTGVTIESEGCTSGPLSATCVYQSATDATRETCTARLETQSGPLECRIVLLRTQGSVYEPGLVYGVDPAASGCGAA